MRGALREIRRGRAVTAVAAATSLVLLSLLAGCSATGVVEKAKLVEPLVYASVLGDGESNFEGRLLQVVIEGLATGASEQAGGDAYGNILALLGWGGSGSDNYGRMQQTLNDVDAGIATPDREQLVQGRQQQPESKHRWAPTENLRLHRPAGPLLHRLLHRQRKRIRARRLRHRTADR